MVRYAILLLKRENFFARSCGYKESTEVGGGYTRSTRGNAVQGGDMLWYGMV